MQRTIEELYEKFAVFHEKHKDPELDDFLLTLAKRFEDADAMYHQLGYLLMHIRATVVYQARPKHLNEAIERAERFLARYAEEVDGAKSGKKP
jgi:hypothetical protein